MIEKVAVKAGDGVGFQYRNTKSLTGVKIQYMRWWSYERYLDVLSDVNLPVCCQITT